MRFRKKTHPLVTDSINNLDERFPFWLTKVLNIGEPIMDTSIETAAIAFDERSRDFAFRMNPEFAASLTTEQRAFLMSHEAMHVVRNDMATHANPYFTDKDALNLAMDCIINDTLTNAGMIAPEWAAQGVREAGFDCDGQTTKMVYDAIIEKQDQQQQQQQEQSDDSDSSGQSDKADSDDSTKGDEQGDGDSEGEADSGDQQDGDSDGEESSDSGDGGSQSDDDKPGDSDRSKPMNGGGHGEWSEKMAQAAADHAEGTNDDGEESEVSEHGGTGDIDAGDYQELKYRDVGTLNEDLMPNLDFESIFKHLEPELVDGFGMGMPPKADWRRPRRNMMGVWPKTTLPSRRDDVHKLALASKRMQLVVFLDNSGSVSDQDLRLFRAIAKVLPRAKADYLFVAAASYATQVSAEDLFDDEYRMPECGYGAGMGYAQQVANTGKWGRDSDRFRTAELLCSPQWRAMRSGDTGIMEFDAMNAWIKIAMDDGRLRSYPKSVMVISDAESVLSTATEEEASRWQVFTNLDEERAQHVINYGNQDQPRAYARKNGYRSARCLIPTKNFHRLGDYVLNDTHVKKRARV